RPVAPARDPKPAEIAVAIVNHQRPGDLIVTRHVHLPIVSSHILLARGTTRWDTRESTSPILSQANSNARPNGAKGLNPPRGVCYPPCSASEPPSGGFSPPCSRANPPRGGSLPPSSGSEPP